MGYQGYLHNFQDQRIKFQVEINKEFQMQTEARILASDPLGVCGVFWSQLVAKIEVSHLKLVTKTYRNSAPYEGKA